MPTVLSDSNQYHYKKEEQEKRIEKKEDAIVDKNIGKTSLRR